MAEFSLQGVATFKWKMKLSASSKKKAEESAIEKIKHLIGNGKNVQIEIKATKKLELPEEKPIKTLTKAQARKKIAVVTSKRK